MDPPETVAMDFVSWIFRFFFFKMSSILTLPYSRICKVYLTLLPLFKHVAILPGVFALGKTAGRWRTLSFPKIFWRFTSDLIGLVMDKLERSVF